MSENLPPELIHHLPDAVIEVVSWSGAMGELVLRVRKEIGPESGLLRLAGVSYVSIASSFTVGALTCARQGDGDVRFEFDDAWGGSHTIFAASLVYEIDPELPTSKPGL